jgi:P-type Mg2+ transporter
MDGHQPEFWNADTEELLAHLEAREEGLSSAEAARRLKEFGPNLLKPRKRRGTAALLLGQFKSPIILILIGAAIIAMFVGERTDAVIIVVIVLFSGLLGFWQERGAANAVQKLLDIVRITAAVLRDSKEVEIPVEDLVPGDIVVLNAGDIIPADARILESKDLYVDEATLTGETFPVEKDPADVPADAPLAKRTNAVFMGTHVVSGSAKAVVAHTGKDTEFGKVSESLGEKPQETEFEHGIKHFGYFLLEITLIMVVAIFAINVYFKRPVLESFLFALALAVGLTPQLLPAIITINLSKGARRMAERKVIVKRMDAIENFGSMDVFCSDKTGTLTEGIVQLDKALDIRGGESGKALLYAFINSSFETGFNNPIDDAIRKLEGQDISSYRKIDEVPYDFVRKRLSILASSDAGNLMTTKGAVSSVLEACSSAEEPDGSLVPIEKAMDDIQARYRELSTVGLRTLGVAFKRKEDTTDITSEDETGMTFLGILALSDPPKQGIADTIRELGNLGVSMKVITGDNRLVAANVGARVGLANPEVLTGSDLERMRDEALVQRVRDIDVFAEVEPNQKETIIRALSKAGNVVGYMGDGINDAPALHAADVGISVDGAVDVAKEAADFVLLEKDLGVLANGVREGRVTFANTMKYVFMATSANFGNMFSMAGASLFLDFLPLLPGQVLLTNLMTDFPEMTIATDNVDPEMVEKPRRWDIRFIRKFMLVFGLLSSVFDYATFAVLLLILHANKFQFRTGWFVESVISAAMIVLVIRTRRVFFKSRPGKYLLVTTLLVAVATVALPYTPLGKPLGFTALPAYFYLYLGAIMVLYISSAEVAKRFFYRWVKY